jgi:hypothetical protein
MLDLLQEKSGIFDKFNIFKIPTNGYRRFGLKCQQHSVSGMGLLPVGAGSGFSLWRRP